jgi:hypothetical protein
VPSGADCELSFSTVAGSLAISAGASVQLLGDTIGGNVTSLNANAVTIAVDTQISGNTTITATGGGFPPALCDAAYICIGGGNTFGGNVTINNTAADYGGATDPAFVSANTIAGSLSCSGNVPVLDNGGAPNTVAGHELGQCAGL